MAFTLHVIHPEDFVRLRADGHIDLAQTRNMLFQAGAALCARGIDNVILDFREATGQLTVTDMYELVTALGDAGFQPSNHLAILHRPGPGELAKFFSLCAGNRGWQVGAFATFEEAFDWLNRSEHAAIENRASSAR